MKIGVCFKIVPDYEGLLPEEWQVPGNLDFTYVKKMYGCFDEPALEMALRIADSCRACGMEAEDVETVAVTCGAPEGAVSESLLRALFAAGFSDVVLLPESGDFSPARTAKSLASWFTENPCDLILTGRMVGPGDSGMVPFYLAEELGVPLFTELVSAAYNGESGRLEITCKDSESLKTYSLSESTVGTVGDAEAAYLRLFPLKARMEAKKRVFTQWEPAGTDCSNRIDTDTVLRSEPAEETRQCRIIPAEDRAAAAKVLLGILRGEAE